MILITGGSASGKSAYAEQRTCEKGTAPTYLATMHRGGPEAEERILKHRRMREGKGFKTLEAPVKIRRVLEQCSRVVLLEDLGNLVANEMFGESRVEEVAESIFSELCALDEQCERLVIVTDEVFSDGGCYEGETLAYLRELGRLNALCAARSEEVWEVICGIPKRLR